MCINPSFIWVQCGPKWEKQPVGCKACWRCKRNRVNDYVGRCLAEAAVSSHTCVVNLTYAPRDDLADKLLQPRHFQLFMKLLRRAGHKVRYFVAGEYGEEKGRAHFHAILFFTHLEKQEKTPAYNWGHLNNPETSARFSDKIPHNEMVHIREWPHGHILCDWSFSEKSVRYVCKYLLKEDKNSAWLSLSKKPAIGSEWFQQKAAIAKALGVLPSSWNYLPPGGDKDKAYFMSGATRRDYLNAITTNADDMAKANEWTQKTFAKYARQRLLRELEAQPPHVIDAAVNERHEREQEQARLAAFFRHLAEVDHFDEMMHDSGGPLRRSDGQWQPERKHDEPNSTPSPS